MALQITGTIIICYLLGAIPFSYIIARLVKGLDIREAGSGNVGPLSVWRNVNPFYGVLALALDMGKGALAIYIAKWMGLSTVWVCIAGFAAVIGHDWPVFLKFHGGKGASVIMGVLLAFMPVQTLIGIGIALLILIPQTCGWASSG